MTGFGWKKLTDWPVSCTNADANVCKDVHYALLYHPFTWKEHDAKIYQVDPSSASMRIKNILKRRNNLPVRCVWKRCSVGAAKFA